MTWATPKLSRTIVTPARGRSRFAPPRGGGPERCRLEVAPDVARGDRSEERSQRVVELRLVSCVAVERQAPVLARGQDRPRGRCVVPLGTRGFERREQRQRGDQHRQKHSRSSEHARDAYLGNGLQSGAVDALLAFARRPALPASLRRSRSEIPRSPQRPSSAAWSAGLAAYAASCGALAWGAAAGWNEAAFRVYYLGGGLLTAALLGAGSALLVGRRWVAPVALVYAGLAIGLALAVPLQGAISGTDVPEAQDVLDLWPARVPAIAGELAGDARRRRRRGVDVQDAAAGECARSSPASRSPAIGSGLAGLGVGALAPAIAAGRGAPLRRASSRLGDSSSVVTRFAVETALAEPDPDEDPDDGEHDERLDDRAGHAAVGH